VADLDIRALKKGLSAEERETLTFQELRLTRLEALVDGVPLSRTLPDDRSKEEKAIAPRLVAVKTTSPTINHMSSVVNIAVSSLRTYEAGTVAPRWEIGTMVRFAETLGLTVEELNTVMKTTAKVEAAKRVEKAKKSKG
jgi:hypothetical protein